MMDAIVTSTTSTLRFDHWSLRCSAGQRSEPRMPDKGVRMPTRMSAEGDMCRVVLPKRIAVDVMVVNPVKGLQ